LKPEERRSAAAEKAVTKQKMTEIRNVVESSLENLKLQE
jgi:hypothetical protein